MIKKIIYDLGANVGQNIPYYLLRSDLVVAVEANPELCELIKKNFSKSIFEKKLIVENCVVTKNKSGIEKFYISKLNNLWSTIDPNFDAFLGKKRILLSDFYILEIKSKNIIELIHNYGEPYYIKIDLENYDDVILNEILLSNLNPIYISAEVHKIEVFDLLINSKKYNSYKLLDCNEIQSKYSSIQIKRKNFPDEIFTFVAHSSGPFGNDIKGPWFDKDMFKKIFLMSGGVGWKDIHCSLID